MTTAAIAIRPDQQVAAIKPGTVMAQDTSARYEQEVKGMLTIARQLLRDTVRACDNILSACGRAELAEVSSYQYSRGGTDIVGPSIRLMEAIAGQWGNLVYGMRELSQQGGESQVEAFAWDTETNVRASRAFTIKHVRYTRAGSYALEDGRDIYELVANNGQRRVRACLMAVIPRDVVDAAIYQCEKTLQEKRPVTPDNVKNLLAEFAKFGVTREQIEGKCQRRLDAITSQHLVQLARVLTSLKDGMGKPSDFFVVAEVPAEKANGNVEAALTAAKTGRRRASTPEPAEPAEPRRETSRDAVNDDPTDIFSQEPA
jgi:hypothetical protein